MNYDQLAKDILADVGGADNISSFTNCMTRLRVNVKSEAAVDAEKLKAEKGVMGIVEGQQMQIIVGPGHAQRLRDAFEKVSGIKGDATVADDVDYEDVAAATKAGVKSKQNSAFQRGLKHIGNIFIPLIPGFVATGLIAAIANVCKTFWPELVTNPWFLLFAAGGGLLVGALNIVAGYNAAKEFGGSAVIGAIMGALVSSPALAGIAATATTAAQPLEFIIPLINFTVKLSPNLGGVIGVIFSAFICAMLEKQLRKVVPAVLDLFVVPFVTIIVGGFLTIFIIMPIAAIVMNGLIYILVDILLNQMGIVGGYVLSATFLPMVMLGIHQAFTPIHTELITTVGYTVLLPIMAMAGAGQVGAAIAVFVKTKDLKLKETAASGLPVGFLGVGEPLIYGVSLPLFWPFVTACLGAGFGGAFIALANTLGNTVGAVAIGPSGLLLIPLIANGQWLWYVGGLVISYFMGFVLTYFFGYNDKLLERLR